MKCVALRKPMLALGIFVVLSGVGVPTAALAVTEPTEAADVSGAGGAGGESETPSPVAVVLPNGYVPPPDYIDPEFGGGQPIVPPKPILAERSPSVIPTSSGGGNSEPVKHKTSVLAWLRGETALTKNTKALAAKPLGTFKGQKCGWERRYVFIRFLEWRHEWRRKKDCTLRKRKKFEDL